MVIRAAIISDGVVSNIIVVDALDFMPGLVEATSEAQVGDQWDGEHFVKSPAQVPDIDAEWATVRAERDRLLAATDWWVIRALEGGPAMTAAQTEYRQALRDITLQPDPFNIVWPVQPT